VERRGPGPSKPPVVEATLKSKKGGAASHSVPAVTKKAAALRQSECVGLGRVPKRGFR